jgi:hypothetical protein
MPAKKVQYVSGYILANVPASQFTLTWQTCYLDSCVIYHSFFVEEFLSGVGKGETTMNVSWNAGAVSTSTKG